MTEDRIKDLLQEADRIAGVPEQASVDTGIIRHRAHKRYLARKIVFFTAAAAAIILTISVWTLSVRTTKPIGDNDGLVRLQAQVKYLQARTDATLKLVQEMLQKEQKQRELEALQAQLESIGDPREEISQQVERTALILVFQADRMYRELGQKNSAIQAYSRVIELFPQSRWAKVARQRLLDIQNAENVTNLKGDSI
jgi:tetratricopeptide (TPR) repeat protein